MLLVVVCITEIMSDILFSFIVFVINEKYYLAKIKRIRKNLRNLRS